MIKLRVLDLFSGIGGFSLGLERTGGFETVAFCEIEEFPRRILAKHWPGTPIHRDVRNLKGADVGPVDVICGGYPCQPFSTAGKRRGAEDDRHLWPEYRRLIEELGPTWVIGENVAGHISMGLDDVLSDLEALGYACRAFVVPACAVGAPHRRDRIWIVANASGERGSAGAARDGCDRAICDLQRDGSGAAAGRQVKQSGPVGLGDAADADSERSDQGQAHRRRRKGGSRPRQVSCAVHIGRRGDAADADRHDAQGQQPGGIDAQERSVTRTGSPGSHHASEGGFLITEPPVRGADDGVPAGLDAARLKALGNAVVPAIPEMIGRAILQAEAAP